MNHKVAHYLLNFFAITIILLTYTDLSAQTLELNWKLETKAKLVAGPVIDENNAYVGNENGKFLAIDLLSGKIFWEFETGGNIQAKAVLIEELVFFESANCFYALNKKDGKKIWKHTLNIPPEKFTYADVDYLYKLDPFDDKRSSGVVHNGIIYIGTSNGKILGLNVKTGQLEFSVASQDHSPIRSTPLVFDGKLFYGDWNGIVYCYDLKAKTQIWQKSTYRDKPYATFGGIASEFIIQKGKLFFGARNPMMNVLWMADGQKEWTYTDPDGGWLIGDPVIYNDTLYIGGSDNFTMLAFDINDGKPMWKNKRSKNIYVKPIVTDNWVIYAGGNSYNPGDSGEIVMLDRITGNTIATFDTATGVFSSPVLVQNKFIIFGSLNGIIYSLKIVP